MHVRLIKIGVVWSSIPAWRWAVLLLFAAAAIASAADIPELSIPAAPARAEKPRSPYQWHVLPAAIGAEVLTLWGEFDTTAGRETQGEPVPLVAILRDSLGDDDPTTDRLRYVWLLTYSPPSFPKRFLSAIPFFYWRLGADGKAKPGKLNKPILDVSHPTHPVWNAVGRNLVQWLALDGTPARASSRAYRTNLMDHERLHLQEAIEFLRNAPDSAGAKGLSRSELDSVIGRLILRKNLLGGLMQDSRLDGVADARAAQRSETIGRNWELLRTSAERAGLYFEPLRVGGENENYAVVWFPLDRSFSAPGINLDTTWKLLHISNPWNDEKLRAWTGYRQVRYLDGAGGLLPSGQNGPRSTALVPLAVYSLTYPRTPLLLMDFRSPLRTRRREIFQRSVDELVSGVLGLSHFANWYYFAGDALYDFVKSRRGGATGRTDRLDCYSEFRVALQLDNSLDADLRTQMQKRLNSMSMNPLESSVSHELDMARGNYQALQHNIADSSKLSARIDKDRRRELASFGESYKHKTIKEVAHFASLGMYTNRASRSDENLAKLRRDRTIAALLQQLKDIADGGVSPEISFPQSQIESSISQLARLAHESSSASVKRQAAVAITRVERLSNSDQIKTECARALTELQDGQVRKLAKSAPPLHVPSAAPIKASSLFKTQ